MRSVVIDITGPTEKLGATESNSAPGFLANNNAVYDTRTPEPLDPGQASGFGVSHASAEPCVCGCGGGACIPQREYDGQNQHAVQEVIRFSVNGKCGYPLKQALEKEYTGLDGRNNVISVDSKSSFSIRLEVRPSVSK